MTKYDSWELTEAVRENMTHFKRWDDGRRPSDYRTFPYPDEHSSSLAEGELAGRIRVAFGHKADDFIDAVIVETKQYGGYSEWTQDNMEFITLECGNDSKDFRGLEFTDNGELGPFGQMLAWLDEKAPLVTVTVHNYGGGN
jgi:hypothetical protein